MSENSDSKNEQLKMELIKQLVLLEKDYKALNEIIVTSQNFFEEGKKLIGLDEIQLNALSKVKLVEEFLKRAQSFYPQLLALSKRIDRTLKRITHIEKGFYKYISSYQTLIDSFTDDFIVVNTNGEIEFMNKSALDRRNLKFPEYQGKLLLEIETDREAEVSLEKLQHCIDSAVPHQEDRLIKGRWYTVIYHPMTEEQRENANVLITYSDITDKKIQEEWILKNYRLLEAITFIQSQYIHEDNINALFENILNKILEATECEYGFIGKIVLDAEGKPYLKCYSVTDISWNEEVKNFFDTQKESGFEFHNLNSLFGHVMTTGKYVISNNPASDPRRGGLPPGHPPLYSFLGYPLYSDDKMIGMIGLANKAGGFDSEFVYFFEPLFRSCTGIIQAVEILLERNKAEESLKRKEKSLSEAQRIAHMGSWESNFSTYEILWSDEVYRICGVSKEEFINSYEFFLKLVHPDDHHLILTMVEEMHKNEGHVKFEHRIVRPDGSIRYVLEQAEFLYEDGKEVGLIGTMLDTTEIKLAEEKIISLLNDTQNMNLELELREEQLEHFLNQSRELINKLEESEARLNEAQEIAQLGRWELDVVSQKVYWSDEVFKIFGVDNFGQAIGMEEYLQRIYPEDKEMVVSTTQEALANGGEFELEHRLVKTDGEIRWSYVKGKPVKKEGKVTRLIGIMMDISEKKFSENRLKKSEQLFKALIQNSSDFVLLLNSNSIISYISPSIENILGFSASQIFNKNLLELICPEDISLFQEVFQQLKLSPGKSESLEIRLKPADKSVSKKKPVEGEPCEDWIWVEALLTNLLDDSAVGAIVANIRDITERKRSEERLKQKNDELTKINAELDKFVYRSSHDLRAPLVSVLGLINIIKLEEQDDHKEEYLNMMEKSIYKLDNFIQSIVNYSRNTRLSIEVEKIDLKGLITEVFNEHRFIERAESIDKRVTVSGEVDFYSDPFRLRIVFSNLISNAIRYSNPRRNPSFIHVNVVLSKAEAIIQFVDNGIGIQQENIDRIFDMFFRAATHNVGSGLGLYIVKDVVETLQGKITVQSIFGEGTTFTVKLPNLNK